MKAMKLTGLLQMNFFEVPDPEIKNDNDVLIKMKTVGVCGSDIHYYVTGKIGSQVVKYPFTVGHEGAGEVIATGRKVSRVKPGDRIAIDPAMPCDTCDQCKAGRPHTCRNLKFLGCPGQAEGCLSDYIVMPEKSCYPLDDNMNFVAGAISEPLSIGLYAIRHSELNLKNLKIGIFGFGPIGMSVLLSAKAKGATTFYVTDKIDERLAIARKSGASWTGNPDRINIVNQITGEEPLLLDAVFECCGQQEAVNQAIKLLKPGGLLNIIGIPDFDRWSFSCDDFRHKEITVKNVRRQNDTIKETLELMQTGLIDISLMPTHHFTFADTKEAFDLVAGYHDGVMKAIIHFD